MRRTQGSITVQCHLFLHDFGSLCSEQFELEFEFELMFFNNECSRKTFGILHDIALPSGRNSQIQTHSCKCNEQSVLRLQTDTLNPRQEFPQVNLC